MRGTRCIRRLTTVLLVVLGLAGLARWSIASEGAFKIIVHPDNAVTTVDRDLVRDAFLRRSTEWNGETVRPIDLSPRFAARARFTEEVLHKTPAQLRTYWNQQIFSGKGVPPPEVDAAAEVVAYVLAHRGAIGYLPADADAGGARVVPVR